MLKKAARQTFRKRRAGLTDSEQEKLDDLMLIQFQMAPIPFVNTILSYWPIEENREPNTHLITEFMRFRNPELKICYPVSDFETTTLHAVQTDIDTPFEKRKFDIYEPDGGQPVEALSLDLVLVPLLAFDEQGFRVGYGKGFYDKYLATCRRDCIRVGFSYFEPIDIIEDRHDFDVPLNFCITPDKLYVF